MPELAEMKVLRNKQAKRLADVIAADESKESIAREKKLLDDIDAGLKVFGDIKVFLSARDARFSLNGRAAEMSAGD